MINPLISVIVPVYNTGKHLGKCLESILNQTYQNLEVILINDGSVDNSEEICRSYAEKDDRIIFISRDNRGVSATRNEGINIAHGDFFSFIDADDYLDLDMYEYLIGIINDKKVDTVNFEHYITYSEYEVEYKSPAEAYGYADRKKAQYNLLFHYPFACNKLFSKKMVGNIRFNEELARGEDCLFARQCFENAENAWFDERALYHYVQSEESACRGSFRKSQLTYIKLYEIFYEFYSERYPELLAGSMAKTSEDAILIYGDMWLDNQDLRKEQRILKKEYDKYFGIAIRAENLSLKQKIKFLIFRISPWIFCMIHKILWKK